MGEELEILIWLLPVLWQTAYGLGVSLEANIESAFHETTSINLAQPTQNINLQSEIVHPHPEQNMVHGLDSHLQFVPFCHASAHAGPELRN